MNNIKNIRLTQFGSFFPPKRISNEDILISMGSEVSENILYRAVGSKYKRVASADQMGSDMMAMVGEEILRKAGVSKHDIDLLICSCDPIDQAAPDSAVVTQYKLGLKCPAFGISMSCVGWICGIRNAIGLLQSGYSNILVLSASTVGSKFKFNSPMHRAIFGDGCGGVLVQSTVSKGAQILHIDIFSIGKHFKDIYGSMPWSAVPDEIPEAFRNGFYMNPDNKVYFDSLDANIKPFFENALKVSNVRISDISRFIVHQASMPIYNHTVSSFGIPKEKVANYYEMYGNTISAELPCYTDLELKNGNIKEGDLVCYLTYGAGFTAGVMMLKF